MGIYGMGKAFNLRYANSGQFRSQHVRFRQPSRPMFGGNVSYTENTNITIKNGPSGFWGFLSGLFGGLFGGGLFSGGLFGGLFGGGMNMGMGMGMGMPMGGFGFSPFGMLNTQMSQPTDQPQKTDELGNLKKMYSKYEVLPNGNGTYTLTTGKGDNVKTGTYEELMKGMQSEEPQGNSEKKETVTPESKSSVGSDTSKKATSDDGKSQTTNNDGWSTAKSDDIKNYKGNISINDFAKGGGASINGDTTISAPGANTQGFPETITVKNYTYKFKTVDTDGNAIYESQQGNHDTYKLEKNGNSFGLNQHQNDNLSGVGKIDISGLSSTKRQTSSNKTVKTTTEEPQGTTSGHSSKINASEIKKDNTGVHYTYRDVPRPDITVSLSIFEAQGLTQGELIDKLQAKLDAAIKNRNN